MYKTTPKEVWPTLTDTVRIVLKNAKITFNKISLNSNDTCSEKTKN